VGKETCPQPSSWQNLPLASQRVMCYNPDDYQPQNLVTTFLIQAQGIASPQNRAKMRVTQFSQVSSPLCMCAHTHTCTHTHKHPGVLPSFT
jgi:hypothetical protein